MVGNIKIIKIPMIFSDHFHQIVHFNVFPHLCMHTHTHTPPYN